MSPSYILLEVGEPPCCSQHHVTRCCASATLRLAVSRRVLDRGASSLAQAPSVHERGVRSFHCQISRWRTVTRY